MSLGGSLSRRIALLVLCSLLFVFVLTSAASADTGCGGHGQPACDGGACGQGLQACGDGKCWMCCGDGTTNGVCGTWEDGQGCDGNPLSFRYDADCAACGGHAGPWCKDPLHHCDDGLQECDSGTGAGMCYWCCADTTKTCGSPPASQQRCQNDNPSGPYYDSDCTDQELCVASGGAWVEENTWVSPAPTGNYGCCGDSLQCYVQTTGIPSNRKCAFSGTIYTNFNNIYGELIYSSLCYDTKVLKCVVRNPGVNQAAIGAKKGAACCSGHDTGAWWTTAPLKESQYASSACSDHMDNDCNGLIDCADPSCVADPACKAPPCGGVGQPQCPGGKCGAGLQRCLDGTCRYCCADVNQTCGDPPSGRPRCQNDNPSGSNYDPDCSDKDLCLLAGKHWLREDSWLTDRGLGPYYACCFNPTDCVSHNAVSTYCEFYGQIFFTQPTESNLCHNIRSDLCGSGLTPVGTAISTPLGAACCEGQAGWSGAGWTYWPRLESSWYVGCQDRVDNDCNGLIDCADPSCADDPVCKGAPNCTDDDHDGYYAEPGCETPLDCDDSNATIHPGQPDEECNATVDINCDGEIRRSNATLCPPPECVKDEECDPIDCPAINGTVNGTCEDGTCHYVEPPFGCIAMCGDGLLQPGEECDSSDWGNVTGCRVLGNYTGGTLSCTASCLFNTTLCTRNETPTPICGNNIVEPPEQCDNGSANSLYGGCGLNCTICSLLPLPDCAPGFHLAQVGDTDGDGCGGYDCLPDAVCGDGVLQTGEECDGTAWGNVTTCSDLGSFTGGTLSCAATCLFNTTLCTRDETPGPVCGNGLLETGEECDGSAWGNVSGCHDLDNYTGGTLSCSATCLFNTTLCTRNETPTPICGNALLEVGEQCDNGTANGVCPATCSATCTLNQCQLPGCGDSIVQADEQCDDGAANGPCPASCSASCTRNSCGRGGSGGGGGGSRWYYPPPNATNVTKPSAPAVVPTPAPITVAPAAPPQPSPLIYSPEIRVPILSIVEYQVTVVNTRKTDLKEAKLSIGLPTTWEYDGPQSLGLLKPGERRSAIFRILVSEDLDPNKEFTIILAGKGGVVAEEKVKALVDIPEFLVRIKPSLDSYAHETDGEVYVIVNNRKGEAEPDLEVELDINGNRTTDYVQYLGVFAVRPYSKFRYQFTYPVERLTGDTIVAEGWLRQRGNLIATSDDTARSVYHPTPYEKDARPDSRVRERSGS